MSSPDQLALPPGYMLPKFLTSELASQAVDVALLAVMGELSPIPAATQASERPHRCCRPGDER